MRLADRIWPHSAFGHFFISLNPCCRSLNGGITMNIYRYRVSLLSALVCSGLFVPANLFADGSKEDYDRAQSLKQRVTDKIVRDRIVPNWLTGDKQFWYEIKTGPNSREWVLVDAEKGERRAAFDREKLAAALADETKKKIDADNLPISEFSLSPDLNSIKFTALGKNWECDTKNYTLHSSSDSKEKPAEETTVKVLQRPQPSQDGGAETTVRFINHTTEPVKLLWIDASGERTGYGTIEADHDLEQNTFAGHVWLVTDNNDRPLGTFEATATAGVAVIDPAQRGGNFGRGRGAGGFRRAGGPPNGRANSPDGKWTAAIKDHNLVVRDSKGEEEVKLTTDGTADDPYVGRFYWSPDSAHLVGIQEKVGEHREIHFIQSSPADQVQPKLVTLAYDKPGDKLPVARPRLFDIANKKQIPVAEDLFTNAWGITELRWQPDSKRFTFLFNQRGHQVLRIVAVDAESGEAKPIVDEHSPTFIDYSEKLFTDYLDKTHEIIWMSERDGWNHLYLYDAQTGEVKNQITRGPWVVRGVDRVDEEKRQIWFRAGGIHAEQDPYYVHYCRVNFDGTGLVVLTAGDGTHEVQFSPDRQYIIDTYTRVDMAPVSELRRTNDGSLVCALEHADSSALSETRLESSGTICCQRPRRRNRYLRHHSAADEFRSGKEISGHRKNLCRAARCLCAERI